MDLDRLKCWEKLKRILGDHASDIEVDMKICWHFRPIIQKTIQDTAVVTSEDE